MFRRLRSFALAGLIVLFPVVATWWAMRWLFDVLDNQLQPIWGQLLGQHIPGLGAVAGIALMIAVGALAEIIVGRRLIAWGENLLLRMPLIRSIYGMAKTMTEALMGSQRRSFREVALVEYPRAGMYTVMFVTGRHRSMVSLFIPTVPNPTSGWFLILPEDQVEVLPISVEDGLKWAVSGGVIVPAEDVPELALAALERLQTRRAGVA